MRPFAYTRAASPRAAVQDAIGSLSGPAVQGRPPVEYLAGGTTLLDLMKLDVMRPSRVVDLVDVAAQHRDITVTSSGLHLGAFATMAATAAHPALARDYPVIAQSLRLAASAQIRNMATLGGNVLQRTRCPYFRDLNWLACNKREPGSGCTALTTANRQHAVLGGSDACIATYPGDFGQALIALNATVEVTNRSGVRSMSFALLHREPGTTPHLETTLAPGDLITGFHVPAGAWTRRSLYLKIRDRQSYEFALASAAVALAIEDGTVRVARVALGGVATIPWRSLDAEAALIGKPLDEQAAKAAAVAAFAMARPRTDNRFKVSLGKETLVRALLEAAHLEV